MLDPLYQAIGWLLAFFYGLVPNLGVAIILLTCTVMLVLFPLTAKQARSMLAMQEIQPELKKLQAKYKGDRQKLVEEQQKLFQEHKVNPLGGCLPLVAQFPIFISLFSVLRDPYKNVPVDSDLFRAFCGDLGEAACGRMGPKHLEFLGMDLTVSALDASGGLFTVAPYFILVGLVILAGYFQSRQTQRTTPAGANPQMQMIGKVLPIGFGVFSLWFPAGLVLYFLVSNLWRLGQQEVIFRKIHLPHRARQEAQKAAGKSSANQEEVIDVEPAEPGEEAEAPPAPARRPKARPRAATPPPAPTGAKPTGGQPTGGAGRLREFFRLPPAPNGEPAPPPPAPPPPAPPPAQKKSGTSSGAAKRQGQSQARRRRNKKRKR